ncbi:hypothetical protein E3N88_44297 [Mikania micrantha]|uniref:Uncharacterized protein n=1 Tax=Mikania micrantha TaxID=192012 RepID=A0A5N6LCE9_9ASTR|nr:hypothetical protein E3N88_44297 [Mikania micrantha]
MEMTVQTSLRDQIIQAQQETMARDNLKHELDCVAEKHFETKQDGVIYFQDRVWIPAVDELRTLILDVAHKTRYSIHPGADKMYQDLRSFYRWPGMKKVVATYVGKCLTCAKVKAGHQKPSRLLEQPEIPQWKWEQIAMDFITKLPRTSSGHDSIWQSLGTSVNLSTAYHPQMDGQTTTAALDVPRLKQYIVENVGLQFVGPNLQATRSRQKGYADKRRKPLEFQVGDRVMLKVSPCKGMVRLGAKGKLAPRYVGPFEITQCIGPVAYRLRLPDELSGVHDVFHVSNLKRCLADESLIIPLEEIQVDEQLHFIEEPIEIMDCEVKRLKRSCIPIVKVRWNSKRGPKFTSEREDHMKTKYPHLFEEVVPDNDA